MTIDTDLVSRINNEHLINTTLKPADLLFVFGTREGVDEFVDVIDDLWRRNMFTWSVVSGGPTGGVAESEADIISRRMIGRGIPPRRIMTEHAAMNTGENVVNSLPIIDQAVGLANISSLIAVGKLCTSRRYLMTLQRYWPTVHKMLVPVNWFGVPAEDWHLHPHVRARIVSEWEKIEPYKQRGFIVDWPNDQSVLLTQTA